MDLAGVCRIHVGFSDVDEEEEEKKRKKSLQSE